MDAETIRVQRDALEQQAVAAARAIQQIISDLKAPPDSRLAGEIYGLRHAIHAMTQEKLCLEQPSEATGLFAWLFVRPVTNQSAKYSELVDKIALVQADLDAKERERNESNRKYDDLRRQLEEESRRYAAARQKLQLLVCEQPDSNADDMPAVQFGGDVKPRGTQIERLRAIAARDSNRVRELAWRIRKRLLAQQKDCPYCGCVLGEKPHADHIYPVAKGGLSVESNMVLVCEDCNFKKSDSTLQVFIRTFSLDRSTIECRLRDLGKDF
jgi:5-methylcytosine-specific restriction endonuclease McrA